MTSTDTEETIGLPPDGVADDTKVSSLMTNFVGVETTPSVGFQVSTNDEKVEGTVDKKEEQENENSLRSWFLCVKCGEQKREWLCVSCRSIFCRLCIGDENECQRCRVATIQTKLTLKDHSEISGEKLDKLLHLKPCL